MTQRCPECDAAVEGSPWCGACGARLPVPTGSATPRAVVGGDDPPSGDGRPWLRRLAVVVVLGALGSLVALGGRGEVRPPASETPAGAVPDRVGEVVPPTLLSDGTAASRQFAPRGSVLWTRSDLAGQPRAEDVVAVGTGHVLVGHRLLRTRGGTTDDALRTLPVAAAAGAFDDDGRWAVAEFGRVVLGGVTTAVTTVVPDGWRPIGPAVAWQDGAPVLGDATGHLALLADDGTVRWRTAEPVVAVGPAGDHWIAGTRDDGSPVVVGLADGRVVGLAAPALALLGDLAVTRPGDVVAVDVSTGTEVWRRPAEGATWRALGDDLVAEGTGGAVLVDPATGTGRGRVEGTGAVASDEVVVVRGPDGVEAFAWSGQSRWRLRLATSATVLAVDATRVAVRVGPPAGARVTVYEAATGLVVADAVLPAAADRSLVASGEALWLLESGEAVAVVDRRTGEDVERGAGPPPTGPDLEFRSGGGAVTVVGGAATVRGTDDGATLWTSPFSAPLVGPPTRAGTSVLVLLADGTVTALAPGTGEVRWRRVLAAAPTAAASDGTVLLVGTADGQVLRLDPSGEVVTRAVVGGAPVEALAAGRPAAALLPGRLVGLDVTGLR